MKLGKLILKCIGRRKRKEEREIEVENESTQGRETEIVNIMNKSNV